MITNQLSIKEYSNRISFQHDPVELSGTLRDEGGGEGGLGDGRVVAVALYGVSILIN